MKIFIDTANVDDIKKANEFGIVDGITTNPSLISKEKNKSFDTIIKEIVNIVNVPISVEVMSKDTEGMIKEAIELSKLSENIVVKIPITPDGLKAIRILNVKYHIKTNATLTFSTNQALLAAKAGATYVSIFIGRLDDIGHDGIQILSDTVKIFNNYKIETQIISASIRHPLHVMKSAKTGVHISTIPYNVIEKMIKHPLTDNGIEKFTKDWEKVNI